MVESVPASFFERIIQRANLRFMVMSGGQYELKRRAQAEDNRSQSGLELDVVTWEMIPTNRFPSVSPVSTRMAC